MPELGKIERVEDLRKIWPNEAGDFTVWLARDENIGFFLLEIELWKINGSVPAPRFNIVERPNDWAKAIKASEGLSVYHNSQEICRVRQ